jgi:predicted nuclease of predicted toxin-antitoxin system
MKFMADECVDLQIIEHLRKKGYEVLYILEINPGISDDELLNLASKESAVLITLDKDFGELVFRQNMLNSGVILLRISGLDAEDKAIITATAIEKYQKEIKNNFMVITPDNIRIRKKELF